MAKQTYSIGGLSLQQVQQVDAFLNGPSTAQPGAVQPPPPAAAAAPPMTTAAPAMPPTATMPPPVAAAAPPPPPAAAPAPVAPAPATGGDLEIASAIGKAASGPMGAKGAIELVKRATTEGYAEGHPKRGSSKYQDVPPEWKAWLIASLTPAA